MNFFILLSRWGLTRKSVSVIDKINDIVLGEEGRRSLNIHTNRITGTKYSMFHYTN